MILHHLKETPNDLDFDYEIPDIACVYKNKNSLDSSRSILFGLAIYDILDEDTLGRILLEVQDTEVQASIRKVLDARWCIQNAN